MHIRAARVQHVRTCNMLPRVLFSHLANNVTASTHFSSYVSMLATRTTAEQRRAQHALRILALHGGFPIGYMR